MRIGKELRGALIGAALAMVAPAAAIAGVGAGTGADVDVLREAQDRADIQKLMWTYARAIDTWNADAYVAVFTEDGSFGTVKGRAALHKMVADFKARSDEAVAKGGKPTLLHHVEGNQYIEFLDRDHARVHYYWMTVSGAGPQPPAPVMLAVGNGLDDVVRVGGKWLIRSRQVTAQE